MQTVDAFRRFSILNLRKTYAALRIEDVALRTSPDPLDSGETANYIMSLIESGRLDATLEKPGDDLQTWVLRFTTGSGNAPKTQSEEQRNANLATQTAQTTQLTEHVREVERRLTLSKEYLDLLRKSLKGKSWNGTGDYISTFIPEEYPPDEDMMEDI